jgi:murein DD-endopeptidase MepM/ murein hydrolase activator NlpD
MQPTISSIDRPRRRLSAARVVALVLAASLFAVVALYTLLTGPRNLQVYPAPEESPYKLPWPAGETRLCGQGNRGVVSHRGWEEFAYDFSMPVGSEVCAASSGIVVHVEVGHDGAGLRAPNNKISIFHADGTMAEYAHLQKGGSLVRVGKWVEQGQPIARSGHVGRSLAPHLHFHVLRNDGRTIPITFADVSTDRGVPRMGFRYTSGNERPRQKSARRLTGNLLDKGARQRLLAM